MASLTVSSHIAAAHVIGGVGQRGGIVEIIATTAVEVRGVAPQAQGHAHRQIVIAAQIGTDGQVRVVAGRAWRIVGTVKTLQPEIDRREHAAVGAGIVGLHLCTHGLGLGGAHRQRCFAQQGDLTRRMQFGQHVLAENFMGSRGGMYAVGEQVVLSSIRRYQRAAIAIVRT